MHRVALIATGNRSLFEVPGSRHGLVAGMATAYDLHGRLGHGDTPDPFQPEPFALPGESWLGAVIGH